MMDTALLTKALIGGAAAVAALAAFIVFKASPRSSRKGVPDKMVNRSLR